MTLLKRVTMVLRGGGLDESPHVYRRLPEVLAAQGSTIEVLHTLRPLVVVMAGADEFGLRDYGILLERVEEP